MMEEGGRKEGAREEGREGEGRGRREDDGELNLLLSSHCLL